MSKLYHITVKTGPTGGYPAPQQDIIASAMDIAVKRALSSKGLRTAKHVTITANLSDHGDYDKAAFTMFNGEGGSVWAPRDSNDSYYRPPSHLRRAQVEERLGIEAQRIIDTCPVVCVVKARSRGVHVLVKRAGFEHIEV